MHRRRKKILFGINSIIPISIGGTEIYCQNLAEALINKGNDVCLICATNQPSLEKNFLGNICVVGIPLNKDKKIQLESLNEFIEDFNPDIFHLHSFGEIFNGRELAFINECRIPCFFTPHLANNFYLNLKNPGVSRNTTIYYCLKNKIANNNITSDYPIWLITIFVGLSPWMGFLKKRIPPFFLRALTEVENIKIIRKSIHGAVALSPWMKSTLEANKFKNISEIPQGVNKVFSTIEVGQEIYNSKKIAFVGRISPEKGIETIFRALTVDKKCNVEIDIIGSSDSRTEYFDHIVRMSEGLNVNFYINKSPEEVSVLLQECCALCLPSNIREVAPLVVEEARALKIVSIVTDINRECFFSKAGIIFFQPENACQLSNLFNLIEGELFKEKRKELTEYCPSNFIEIADRHIELYKT